MHRPILYLLLFAYVTTMLRPAMPYLADGMAHLLWYHEHIATVHTEHGKRHVHFEVEKESKKNNTENNSEENKKAATTSEHTICNSGYEFGMIVFKRKSFPQ